MLRIKGVLSKIRVDISQPPAVVDLKERIGDVEIDTIIGQNQQGVILTINDEVTGVVKMKNLSGIMPKN